MKHGSCDLNLLFVPDVRNVQVDISFQFMLRYETVDSFSFKRKIENFEPQFMACYNHIVFWREVLHKLFMLVLDPVFEF